MQEVFEGMELNRREVCQLLAGGPAALALLTNPLLAKEKKLCEKYFYP